jgi:muramoyltetrapeptide carboxypeptidase
MATLNAKAIAPSGKINSEKFDLGRQHLTSLLDVEIQYSENVYEQFRGMAGLDSNRFDDLISCLTDDSIDILWAIRGGFGATRLLPNIPDNLSINSKLLIGYSDITAYQWLLYKYYQMKSISGHMIQVDFPDMTDKQDQYDKLFSLIRNETSRFDMPESVDVQHWENQIEGPIIGGCLAIISKLMGTPYVPNLDGHILFFEDIDEPIYRIDGYLSHLYNSGLFDHVAGIIFGQFTPPDDADKDKFAADLHDVLTEYREMIKKPVIQNFPIGHIKHIFPLPIGYQSTITRTHLEFRK